MIDFAISREILKPGQVCSPGRLRFSAGPVGEWGLPFLSFDDLVFVVDLEVLERLHDARGPADHNLFYLLGLVLIPTVTRESFVACML